MFIPHCHDALITTTDSTTEESDTNINQDNNINDSVFQSTNCAEDIANVRSQEFEVDDDSESVPENIPIGGTSCDADLKDGQTCRWSSIDRCLVRTPEKEELCCQRGWSPLGLSYIDVFLAFLPLTFLLEAVGVSCALYQASRDDFWGNTLHLINVKTIAHTHSIPT